MPSPFPGMDPYLEDPSRWPAVHSALIVAIQAALNRILPEGLLAKIDEYLWIVGDSNSGPTRRPIKPDVFVPETSASSSNVGIMTTTRPTRVGRLPKSQRQRRRYISIVDGRTRNVFTVLELLSPSNKKLGEDRDAYLQKRREFLAIANFVEIDLLRNGYRMPMGLDDDVASDYVVFACQRDRFPQYEQWTFHLRDPMPIIPVPVDRNTVVALDLRACLDRVYDEGRWLTELENYTVELTPRLRDPDAVWAGELLKKAAKKKK